MKATTQRSLRRYHHYLGVFFAPMIVLFALSGALQTFRLQEEKGYGGTPPGWIVWLASIHMDSRLPAPAKAEPREERAEPAQARPEAPRPAVKRPYTLPLKIFVVLLSLALAASTIVGVIIALTNRALRRTTITLLVAGAVVPAVLLLLL